MKWLFVVLGLVAFGAVALSLWARLAPSDPKYWHVMPVKTRDIDTAGAAFRVTEGDEAGLTRLDQIIRDTPRTEVLAGSVEEGMITYITRSAGFGFPDYTTVQLNGSELALYGRLRIGYSDLGVNAQRVDGWLALLAQGG